MPKTTNLKDLYPLRDVLMSKLVPIPTHFHARLSRLQGDDTFLQQTVEIKVMGEQTLWGALLGLNGGGYPLP